MKSHRLILCILFSFPFLILNGQYFIGGNVQVNNSSEKTEYLNSLTQNTSSLSLTFSPLCARFLTEKLAVGIEIDFTLHRVKFGVNPEIIDNTPEIGIVPFIRYYGWTWNKFSVFGEGYAGIQFSKNTQKSGNTTTTGPHSTGVFLGIYPGLSYALSEKWSFQANLNFLDLNYNYTSTRDGSTTEKASNISFGTGLDNIISTGNLTVGAIYRF